MGEVVTDIALIVVAHPDDEVLGCGGLLAQWRDRQVGDVAALHVAVLTTGVTSRGNTLAHGPLHKQLADSCAHFNVELHHELLPDQRLDSLAFLDLVRGVERLLRRVRPTVIYTHHLGDLNLDHRLTAEAVLTACRPSAWRGTVYSFEIASSTEWAVGDSFTPFRANVYRALNYVQANAKANAMDFYPSERRDPPHPRSAAMLMARAAYWGAVFGVDYAEPYILLRGPISV